MTNGAQRIQRIQQRIFQRKFQLLSQHIGLTCGKHWEFHLARVYDKVDSGDRIPNIKPSSGKQKYRYIYSCERSTIWFCVKYITVFPVISTSCIEYSGQAIGIPEDSDRIYRIRAWLTVIGSKSRTARKVEHSVSLEWLQWTYCDRLRVI